MPPKKSRSKKSRSTAYRFSGRVKKPKICYRRNL